MTHPEEGRQNIKCGRCKQPLTFDAVHDCPHGQAFILRAPDWKPPSAKTYADGLREAAEIARERRKIAIQLLGPVPMPFSMDEIYVDLIWAIESKLAEGER